VSLLDHGTETITIYPAGPPRPDGTRGPAGEPVTMRCRVQPIASDSPGVEGYTTTTTYRILARELPAGPWDRVAWRGSDWTVTGQPEQYRGSRRTRHDTATIRRR